MPGPSLSLIQREACVSNLVRYVSLRGAMVFTSVCGVIGGGPPVWRPTEFDDRESAVLVVESIVEPPTFQLDQWHDPDDRMNPTPFHRTKSIPQKRAVREAAGERWGVELPPESEMGFTRELRWNEETKEWA